MWDLGECVCVCGRDKKVPIAHNRQKNLSLANCFHASAGEKHKYNLTLARQHNYRAKFIRVLIPPVSPQLTSPLFPMSWGSSFGDCCLSVFPRIKFTECHSEGGEETYLTPLPLKAAKQMRKEEETF